MRFGVGVARYGFALNHQPIGQRQVFRAKVIVFIHFPYHDQEFFSLIVLFYIKCFQVFRYIKSIEVCVGV